MSWTPRRRPLGRMSTAPPRYQLMRTHTALDILFGVAWRDYGAHITGGDMKPRAACMNFELENMSSDFTAEVEERAHKEIQAARPIRVKVLPRDENCAILDPILTKLNLMPPSIKEVRTVDIMGLDPQADGGTHVTNTKEVGRIRIIGRES